jgi:hypothetical protein
MLRFALFALILVASLALADDFLEARGMRHPPFFAELQDVERIDDRAYTFGVNGFAIWDISDPDNIIVRGFYPRPEDIYIYRMYRGAVGDSVAFAGRREDQMNLIDIRDETSPQLISVHGAPGVLYEGMALDGELLVAARHGDGLELIDVSDPYSIQTLSEVTSLVNSWDLVIENGYAFVADGMGGLAVVDISNPLAPVHLYSLPCSGGALDVDVENGLAVVACGSGGIEVFDVSDPESAWSRGRANTSGLAVTLDVTGDRVYVADWDDIEVFDLAVPESPTPVAWEETPRRAMGLAADGDRVWLADWSSMRIYDFGPSSDGDIRLTEPILRFQDVPVGESLELAYTLENTGGGILNVIMVESFDDHFEVQPPFTFSIPAGGSHDLSIIYTRDEPGYHAGFIQVNSDDSDEPDPHFLAQSDDNPNYLALGDPAPDFTLTDLYGFSHTLSDHLGQVVVMAFFANW